MQNSKDKCKNITFEECVKDVVRNVYSICIKRPIQVLKLIVDRSAINDTTYFPEKKRRSKRLILFDQIRNIIFNEDVEEYYYLYGCDVMSRREQKQFTPYMKFMRRRNRLNFRSEHNASCILRDKMFFGSIAKTLGINTPENVGLTMRHTHNVVDIKESRTIDILSFLRNLNGYYFCKPINGECGEGIIVLFIDEDNNKTGICNGQELPVDVIAEKLSESDYLIQKKIEQHTTISNLYSKSINTIRLVTVRDINTDEIIVFPSVLRIGNLGNSVDNFSLGGIVVNINITTGQLEKYGFMKSQYGTVMTHHPSTGVEFGSVRVPYIKEAVEQAIRFHSFLNLHSIGWDIAITESGPCFIEGNDNWEIDVQQNAFHPLDHYFKKYFYKK